MGEITVRDEDKKPKQLQTPSNNSSAEIVSSTLGRTASSADSVAERISSRSMLCNRLGVSWNRLSAFWNKQRKKRIESATEVINAEKEYFQALDALQRMKACYLDMEVDLEAERQQRRDRHAAAKFDGEIAIEEKKLKLEELKKARAQLAGDEQETEERNYLEQLEAAMRRADFETALKVIQARKTFKIRTELSKERDRLIEEVMYGSMGELTREQEQRIEYIRSFFDKMIDKIEP
jgi:hypothetical protein